MAATESVDDLAPRSSAGTPGPDGSLYQLQHCSSGSEYDPEVVEFGGLQPCLALFTSLSLSTLQSLTSQYQLLKCISSASICACMDFQIRLA